MRLLQPFLFLFFIASSSVASAAGTVTVIGTGEARARPDRARITVGVETQAKTAGQALTANSRKVKALLGAVRASGIREQQMQTSQVSLQPVYSDRGEGNVDLVGYRAENQVVVTSSQIDSIGPLLDAAVESGANRILGVTFEVSDRSALTTTARAQAMKSAQGAARELASLAGLKLGSVVSIREAGASMPGPMPMAMEARSGVPIEPGTHEISYSVEVTYAVEPKEPGPA